MTDLRNETNSKMELKCFEHSLLSFQPFMVDWKSPSEIARDACKETRRLMLSARLFAI